MPFYHVDESLQGERKLTLYINIVNNNAKELLVEASESRNSPKTNSSPPKNSLLVDYHDRLTDGAKMFILFIFSK